MMDNQVEMVDKEHQDLEVVLDSVSIYQDPLVHVEIKEKKDHQESLVVLVVMAMMEPQDLEERTANMHHRVSQVYPVNQEHLVEMVNQGSQEYLVGKVTEEKPMDWKNMKVKLHMVLNMFTLNYKAAVITNVSALHLMTLPHVHHMERCVINI